MMPVQGGAGSDRTGATATGAWADAFRVVRLGVEVEATTPLLLPPYKGSTLRSALIDRVRRRACSMPERATCAGCPMAGRCAYPPLGEPRAWAVERPSHVSPSPPAGLIVRPPVTRRRVFRAGDRLRFTVTLVGERCGDLALVVTAIGDVEREGIGDGRGRVRLTRLVVAGATREAPLMDLAAPPLEAMDRRPLEGRESVDVVLRTPLRFKAAGRIARDLSARAFLHAVHRRLTHLAVYHQPALGALPAPFEIGPLPSLVDAELRWIEERRKGRRQADAMPIGGLVGRFRLEGPVGAWGPLLGLGELVHVGKNASLGLGAFRMET